MAIGVFPRPGVRRCSLADRPKHREAYPALSTGEAWRGSARGQTSVIWRDRDFYPAGAGRVTWEGKKELTLRYMLEERAYMAQASGEQSFGVVWKGSSTKNARPFAVCPDCLCPVDILVHLQGWSCMRCLDLKNRSSLIAEEVRWSETLEEVEAWLAFAAMRPRLHAKSLPVYVEKREALLGKLAGRRAFANQMCLERVTAEWVADTPSAALLCE